MHNSAVAIHLLFFWRIRWLLTGFQNRHLSSRPFPVPVVSGFRVFPFIRIKFNILFLHWFRKIRRRSKFSIRNIIITLLTSKAIRFLTNSSQKTASTVTGDSKVRKLKRSRGQIVRGCDGAVGGGCSLAWGWRPPWRGDNTGCLRLRLHWGLFGLLFIRSFSTCRRCF